jgi:Zn-dependent protease/CBS domain-containing protein
MGRHSLSLGKIFGIPVGLDWSWFLIFILVTWLLASAYFPVEFKNWPTSEYWIVGAVTSLFFFASVLIHELGHSVVALRYKIPVRSITLFIFGGVSQITKEPPSAFAEFLIASAGPFTSFLLAGIFYGLSFAFAGTAPVAAGAKYLAYINLILGIFNLIPGFPLDGGRVFRGIVWGFTRSLKRATRIAANVGRIVAFGFILFGVYWIFTGNLINGLWIAFIGWFLETAATSQLQQQQIHDLLAGHKVSQAMSRDYTAVPEDLSIQDLLDEHILASGRRSFVVERNDQMVGLLTMHQIKEVPAEERRTTRISTVMLPIDKVYKVSPTTDLEDAIDQMDREGVNQLPVLSDNGKVEGLLSRDDLISFLRTLHEIKE